MVVTVGADAVTPEYGGGGCNGGDDSIYTSSGSTSIDTLDDVDACCELSSAIVDRASSAMGGSTRGKECRRRRRMWTRGCRDCVFLGTSFGEGRGSSSPLSNGRTYVYILLLSPVDELPWRES